MGGPWEKYQQAAPADSQADAGPWTKYQQTSTPVPSPKSDENAAQPDDSIAGGIYRGLAGRGVGIIQTLDDLSGQNILSPAYREAAGRFAKQLKDEGKGTGLKGVVTEAIGDPANWINPTGMGMVKAGAVMGGASAITAPQEDDTGIGNRLEEGATGAAVGAIAAPIIGRATGAVGDAAQYLANKTGLTGAVTGILQKYGRNPSGTALYQAAQDAGLSIKGKTPQEIHSDLQNWLAQNINQIADGVSTKPLNSLGATMQVADAVSNASKASSNAYADAYKAADGQTLTAPEVLDSLDSLIAAAEKNAAPGTSDNQALIKLRALRDSILPQETPVKGGGGATGRRSPVTVTDRVDTVLPNDSTASSLDNYSIGYPTRRRTDEITREVKSGYELPITASNSPASRAVPNIDYATGTPIRRDGTVGVADLLDLRKILNEGFDPSRYATSGDAKVGEFASTIRAALSKAGDANPEFGQKLADADALHSEVSRTLKANEVLDKMFTPEDYQAFKALDRGQPLPDATRQRAAGLLDNIKTPDDLAAITRGLNGGTANALRAAKFRQLMQDSGLTDLNLDENYDLIKASLRNDPAALKLLEDSKVLTDELNRRGVPTDPDFSEKSSRLGEAGRAVWSALSGHPLYAIKHALGAFNPPPTGEQQQLTRFASDLAMGVPNATAVRDVAGAAGRMLGNASADTLGRGYGQDAGQPTRVTIRPQDDLPPVNLPQVAPVTLDEDPAPPSLIDRMTQAESSGNVNAKNPKGSASGILGFTDGTWALAVAKWGKQTGLTLKDKNNPEAQAVMGNLLAQDNARILNKKLGREPTDGEVYAAHFLGAGDAAKLIAAQGTGKDAVLLFPRKVINDNRPIFFDKKRPRSVEEVYALLNEKVS
ncbi:lytic transglycosylase domain-containing protein [Limnoglobus roseus]|uniref:Uncharacterized protein n=1 Tax=Limnoglobus roseus TaxID=2598579 RepID=A0A5C1AQ92_9BACT|nr:lytic transglycosylase domain-containing protein [Limnoglobus roseus]QEL19344.1 hypothetical protein PX52LOC_06413 [Limnoglobus roseus]